MDMRLELQVIDIKDVQFSDCTKITNGVLHINRSELQDLLQRQAIAKQVKSFCELLLL